MASRVAMPSGPAGSARRTYARSPEPEPAPAPAPASASASAPAPIIPLPDVAHSVFGRTVIEPPATEWPGFDRLADDRTSLDLAALDHHHAFAGQAPVDPLDPIDPDLSPVIQRPVASRPAVERPDLAWPEFSWPEAGPDSRGPFEPKLSRAKSPKPRFDAEQFGETRPGEFPEPQQVPLPDSAPDAGWLDTVHWHDASEADEDAPAEQHGRRPGPFRRRKGNAA